MSKIYSRPRIRIPRFQSNRTSIKDMRQLKNKKQIKINNLKKINIIKIFVIIVISIFTAKYIINSVYPIFDSLCETKAKSIATILSNKEATNVMKEHTYDEVYSIEKDTNGSITMIKSNMISINEIISDVAIKIQEDMNKESRENIEIAIRKFYWFKAIGRKRSWSKYKNSAYWKC